MVNNISTLNNLYELKLAKLLIQIHPWSQQAKFARTGGEANAKNLGLVKTQGKEYIIKDGDVVLFRFNV